MKSYIPVVLTVFLAGCSYTIDPLQNYCAEPAVDQSIVAIANAPTVIPDVVTTKPASPATGFTDGTIKGHLFGSQYQVMACHGTLVRADGTKEAGIAVTRLHGGPVGWRDLWLQPSSSETLRIWASDSDIAAYKQKQIASKLAHTPAPCMPYAQDLFQGTRQTGLSSEQLRSTLYSCLASHGVKSPVPPTGMEHVYSEGYPEFFVPYYLQPEAEISSYLLY
ncbi:hypothetical protein [Acetobacter conturbans]|uniref:Lipoprotein n=1 Tax=Acetobacter conturbans TaxID=1737472 RepID=A0ABX0JYC6_9PROT|nr:hypothetical protein [Acetobacter conturbans]NHN88517.1 hypothetical protein [Acetobacter conturbans]